MKKLIITFCFAFICLAGKAQSNVYHSFPDSNAVWKIQTGGFCTCQSGGAGFYDIFQYTLTGPVTIGSQNYIGVTRTGSWSPPNICACGGVFGPHSYSINYGGYRADLVTKKVYFNSPYNNNQEVLIYDFSKQVGDTLHLYRIDNAFMNVSINSYSCVIASIDSVLVGPNYHKRFNINGAIAMIEGVGSTSGLCEGNNGSNLICFKNNSDFYPNTITSCSVANAISSFSISNPEIIIFPNPTNSNITISSTVEIKEIKIRDMLGNLIKEPLLPLQNGKPISIDVSDLENGIYFVSIKTTEGVLSKKIIIQR